MKQSYPGELLPQGLWGPSLPEVPPLLTLPGDRLGQWDQSLPVVQQDLSSR